MNKKLKKFKYISFLVNAIYFVFLIGFGLFVSQMLPSQLYELDEAQFLLALVILLILFGVLFFVINFISIIFIFNKLIQLNNIYYNCHSK